MLLADLGAEVTKVEEPLHGDGSRQWGPPFVDGESAYFLSINRNKRSITVDLKTEAGKEIVRRLAERSDVFIENNRPGIAERLGVGYSTLKQLNPKLIYCSISGFGQDGPYSGKPSYDIIAQAMSGLMSITGEERGEPVKVGIAVADICAGMFASIAILAALNQLERTGAGDRIDISLLDGQISWLSYQAGSFFVTGQSPQRLGSAHPTIAPYQAFKARDAYFVVAVGNDSLWSKFCEALSLNELKDEPRFATNKDRVKNKDELARILNKIFAGRDVKEWLELIDRVGVPCAPIRSFDDIFEDPWIRDRQMVHEIDHPKIGKKIKVLGSPIKMEGSRFTVRRAPPTLGEDTDAILSELGYSAGQISRLRQDKVL
jgi:crotonobetainyl-CoA:carnitine CoA-transferase CaiB-like acyl-CoA transferase